MNETTDARMFLSDKRYNQIKFLVTAVLPAAGTLYFALTVIWGFPSGQQVLGTIMAVQAFFAVVLGISSNQYQKSDARFDGTLTTTETPTKQIVSVETKLHPDELANKDEVLLKVK